MKTKIRNYLFTALTVIIFIIASLSTRFAYGDTGSEHFGNIQLYSTNSSTETINYTTRSDDLYQTVNGVPLYVSYANLTNSCGATAGATIVSFYDKYYEDLIPDYTTYFPATGKYRLADKVYIPALMQELYTLMRTNVDDVGVSEDECIDGLRSYVQNHSHSISYSSVKSSGRINETAYLNSINANKPVIIFAYDTEVVSDIVFDTNADTVVKLSVSDNHVYVGYGYYKVNYYNDSNLFRTDTYLKVSCGLAGLTTGYIRIASTAVSVSQSWLHNAYSVSIT